MNKTLLITFSAIIALWVFGAGHALAKKADWVSQRPIDATHYIGIGSCEKKGHGDDFREVAENQALFDLASEISVNIAGTFIDTTVERTGLSEQNIRMEIQASTQARLQGHQLVDEWQDRKRYWVYFRLPKDAYLKIQQRERARAVKSSLDMLKKAVAENKGGQPVSALRFYFEALSRIQDFIGENLQAELNGTEIFLYNEIYAGIQRILSEISLTSTRGRIPALAGRPLGEPLEVRVERKDAAGKQFALAGVPVRYNMPWRSNDPHFETTTGPEGVAQFVVPEIITQDHGKTAVAQMDVNGLVAQKNPGTFFTAILKKISIPQSSFVLNVYADETSYLWHREFEGKRIMVLSAYKAGDATSEWYKIHDELTGFIQAMGGILVAAGDGMDTQRIVQMSVNTETSWNIEKSKKADLVFVMTARGRLNRRENSKNPFGEDVQFAGEIRTMTRKLGKPYFSDRYKGAGGWNPMGEEMAMDVLALHVFKRWKMKYFRHLGKN